MMISGRSLAERLSQRGTLRLVCAEKIGADDAQLLIGTDWVALYKRLFGAHRPRRSRQKLLRCNRT